MFHVESTGSVEPDTATLDPPLVMGIITNTECLHQSKKYMTHVFTNMINTKWYIVVVVVNYYTLFISQTLSNIH